jgi:oxygen-dependent protoporphyrinogen oxidase
MMTQKKTDVVVVGEGITGLSIAYWLKKRGINVLVLAKDRVVGGTMKSAQDHGFLYELGPNTALETTPLFKELVSDLNLETEFLYANPEGKNRYILRDGILHSMPLGASSFLSTNLFSPSAKLRVMKEPFIGRAVNEESVAEFVERRLGREFLDYAIDPFVAGVFAGKPERLSVRSAFPKLYALEKKYGGLVKGMIRGMQERRKRAEKAKDRSETFSFISGMQALPLAIGKSLGNAILLNANVTGIRLLTRGGKIQSRQKAGTCYRVEYVHNNRKTVVESETVILAIPAYHAAPIIESLSGDTAHVLSSIYYSPVISVFLGVKREDIKRKLDGFGFLIPSKERRKILGCLWNSCLFSHRAPEGMVALNAFIGGARQPELTEVSDEQVIQMTLDELKSIMQLSGKPVYLNITRWQKSIPQYELGYQQKMDALARFEESHQGIVLAGNYRGGIAVGDCVKNAFEIAESVSSHFLPARES